MRFFIIIAFMLIASQAQAANDGINQLITAGQIKADNANDDALSGASRQRDLIGQQRSLRNAQGMQDTPSSNTTPQTIKKPKAKLQNPNLVKIKQLQAQMTALNQKLNSISGLPQDQQQRIQQMQDLMAKMMALMNNLMNKASGTE